MMLLPLAAGMVLVRDERELEAGFAQAAPYLFHEEAGLGEAATGEAGLIPRDWWGGSETAGGERARRGWDQGVRSFQCSRRADVLKLWVALQRHGRAGLGALYDRLCAVAAHLHAAVETRDDFEALHTPESNILCFRYLPPGGTRDPEALDALNLRLRERLNRSGAAWISTTVLEGRRVLRVTVMNPRSRPEHVERLLDHIAELAAMEAS
jgi:L-2,4-diaminobutyrate decarboxylase